ncbi:alpha/beta hydrolase [Nocardia sp. 2]|uniref:Alpha/beta hydrolase n=1 Tax=Nocardia acididurans TaxID=2802282 RepID=A0ABS1M6B5_9NOCA|nr:alpha/beta hydrolase [Nocardia acididurans]MBL1076188.1 alpha/beta hydrolase [Nocardia acididurans]
MPYFEGARGRLHYRRWPVEHPVAVLALLPGTGQHSGHYHRFARAVQPSGIELWALDTSGHGLSEGNPEQPGALSELSADARAFLEQARAHAPGAPVLMGHSLGAATALAVLASERRPPCSALILCGTPKAVLEGRPPSSARGAEPNRTRAAGGSAGSSEPVGGSARSVAAASASGSARSVAAASASGSARSVAAASAYGGGDAVSGPALPPGLPVLIVHGVDDRRAPVDPVREWAGAHGAEFRAYADAGHDLLHEPVHAQVSADIADWVLARG